jgi:hypothetical protein
MQHFNLHMATTLLLTWAEPGMVTCVLVINLTGRTKNKLITEKYGCSESRILFMRCQFPFTNS